MLQSPDVQLREMSAFALGRLAQVITISTHSFCRYFLWHIFSNLPWSVHFCFRVASACQFRILKKILCTVFMESTNDVSHIQILVSSYLTAPETRQMSNLPPPPVSVHLTSNVGEVEKGEGQLEVLGLVV